MATTLDTLVTRVRRAMRDFPVAQDVTGGSLNTSATTVAVANGAQFNAAGNQVFEIDYEAFLLKSVSTNTLTFTRGYAGSTAASHNTGATVLIRPAFLSVEIIDVLNAAKDAMWPLIYKPVLDTSLTTDAVTYEFTVPNMPGTYGGDSIPIPRISKVELKVTGDLAYRPVHDWDVRRGATPKIQFRDAPTTGTLRVHGFGPYPDLTAAADTVDALFPKVAEKPLVTGAMARLLASGEAGRVRVDVGARDDREAANRPGSAMNAAITKEKLFQLELAAAAMPPMPPHVVTVMR